MFGFAPTFFRTHRVSLSALAIPTVSPLRRSSEPYDPRKVLFERIGSSKVPTGTARDFGVRKFVHGPRELLPGKFALVLASHRTRPPTLSPFNSVRLPSSSFWRVLRPSDSYSGKGMVFGGPDRVHKTFQSSKFRPTEQRSPSGGDHIYDRICTAFPPDPPTFPESHCKSVRLSLHGFGVPYYPRRVLPQREGSSGVLTGLP